MRTAQVTRPGYDRMTSSKTRFRVVLTTGRWRFGINASTPADKQRMYR